MYGPPPKPTFLKIAEGNPGHHPLPKHEPQPKTKGHAEAPKWLTKEAKKIWREVVPEYIAINLFYQIDKDVFACYCQAFADFVRLSEEINTEGETVRGHNRSGHFYQLANPKTALRHQAWVRFMKCGAEIGHSPASRARLGKAIDDSGYDELDRFIKRRPA
jgi:P27 family predicted phage terminase small subunit